MKRLIVGAAIAATVIMCIACGGSGGKSSHLSPEKKAKMLLEMKELDVLRRSTEKELYVGDTFARLDHKRKEQAASLVCDDLLAQSSVKHIAIVNPDGDVIGKYTRENGLMLNK